MKNLNVGFKSLLVVTSMMVLIGCGGGSIDSDIPSANEMTELTKSNSESKAIDIFASSSNIQYFIDGVLLNKIVEKGAVTCSNGNGKLTKNGNVYNLEFNKCTYDKNLILDGEANVKKDSKSSEISFDNFTILDNNYEIYFERGKEYLSDYDGNSYNSISLIKLKGYVKSNSKKTSFLNLNMHHDYNADTFDMNSYTKNSCIGGWAKIDSMHLSLSSDDGKAQFSSLGNVIKLTLSSSNVILTRTDGTTKDLGNRTSFDNRVNNNACIIK